jgi:methylthioribose-1-phosphate isomerase
MAHDPTRREFFRTFGQQTVRQAGTVIGAAAELRRASSDAAREILDPGPGLPGPTADAGVAESFRSAYRLSDDGLLILDQRELPGRLNVIKVSEPTEVASAIRAGVINAGPVLAEVAAYALALVVQGAAALEPRVRDDRFNGGANTLRGASREAHALAAAIARLESRYVELTAMGNTDGSDFAAAIRAEADAITAEAQISHAALGRAGAGEISTAAVTDRSRTPGEPINLLMHGDAGPLSCGMVGTGTVVLQSLIGLGRKVHVWVTEAAPGLEGARIAAIQLTQLDVPHTVIADTAVGWLLASRRVDAVLLRGDTVCANDDTLAIIGSLNVAHLAAVAGVPLHVLAPRSSYDPGAADGRSLLLDLRSPAEAMAASVGSDGHPRPAVYGVRLNPTTDVVPGALVNRFLTEDGPRAGARA